jgi:hypothetical protein
MEVVMDPAGVPTVCFISFVEPTEEMKKRREPPTHFMVQYIDSCLVITACYASHIRALKRFLIASHAEKMWINTKAVFATKQPRPSFLASCDSQRHSRQE